MKIAQKTLGSRLSIDLPAIFKAASSSSVDNCKYRRVPIVATLVTFGISSLWGSLLSGGRYFRGVVTFGEQKSFTNKAGTSFFSEIKNEQHKIKKRTTFYLHSICIDCVS